MQRATLFLLSGLLLLAACGGKPFPDAASSGTRDGRVVLLDAASRTQAAKSGRLSLHASVDGGTDKLAINGDGLVDFAHGNSTFTVDMSTFGTLEQRVIDGVMYMRINDAKWIKVEGANSANSWSQLDPTKLLDYLRRVSNDVVRVGSETVRGAATTHYRATVDLPGSSELPIDVWIDDQGYARKATIRTDVGGANLDVELEMYDFGTPVHVEAPPPGDVMAPGSGLGGVLGGILGG